MKRLKLILIMMSFSILAFSQSEIERDIIIAKQQLTVNGYDITGISNDSILTIADSLKLMTQYAVKKYVLANAGSFVPDGVTINVNGSVDTSIIQTKRFVSSFAELDTLVNLPLGSLIRYEPTGGIYKIQSDSIVGVENGAYEVREVGSNYAVLQSQNNAFNIKWFGTVGDGVASDKLEFENAAIMATGKTLILSSDTFNITTSVLLNNNIHIQGVEGTTVKGYFVIDGYHNITIDNVDFIKFSEDWNYAIRMQADAGSNILISRCKFFNTTYFQDLPTSTLAKNITFYKNEFYNSVSSPTAIVTIQVHADNVLIEDNIFEVYNYDGCIKGSSGTGFFRVENNNVKGSFDEEFIDVYTNKSPVTFHKNIFDITAGGVFAVKSGTVGDPHPYPYLINITENEIRGRGLIEKSFIYVSGAFGLPFEDSTQVVNVSDNIIKLDTSLSQTTSINVRGFHKATVNNNTLDVGYDSLGISVYVTAVNMLNVNNNILDGRMLFFASNNPSGEVYDTILQNAVYNVNNNTINAFKGSDQALYFFNQDSLSLNINNNTFHAKDVDNIYSIRLIDCELVDVKINNNQTIVSGTATATVDRIEYASSTFLNFSDDLNSWNAPQWKSIGTHVFNANTGNIAIKYNDVAPLQELEVGGMITATAGEGFRVGNSDETLSGRLYNSGGDLFIMGENGRDVKIGDSEEVNLFVDNGGNEVGIGTTTPAAKLEVANGTVRFSDYGTGTQTGGSISQVAVFDADGDIEEWPLSNLSNHTYDNTTDGGVDLILTGSDLSAKINIDSLTADPNPVTSTTYVAIQTGTFSPKKILIDDLLPMDNRVIITQSNAISILGGTIDATKEYFLDGIIDMGSTSIEIPSGGIYIRGYNFNLSGLTSTSTGYTMFTSPVGGSGDVLFMDFHIDVSGATSQVYDIVGDTGLEAFEISKINYNNCTSLGEISTYRQGLETGTGRFGGTPELTLSGTWVGGFFIETSIVRSLTDGSYFLFKAGTAFSMSSRFRTNHNIDLNTNVGFLDFATSNFPNANTIQLENCIVTRNGVVNPDDANLTPNITKGDLPSKWKNNTGLNNTYVGGELDLTTESVTSITVLDQFETIAGTWTSADLQHFDNPVNERLRHLANVPREYTFDCHLAIDGTAGDILTVRVRRWDDSASGFVTELTQTKEINNFTGGTDIAFFNFINRKIIMDENDYIFLEVANTTSATNDVTLESESYFIVQER